MPPFTIMLRPVSSLCNMRCKYCMCGNETHKITNGNIMTEEVLEAVIKNALAVSSDTCFFVFTGGEPTIRGLDFYRLAVEYVNKYNIHNCRVNYSIQTNGFNLGEEWADFFVRHDFSVGISIDGPKDIHDTNRIDENGMGTFDSVMNTVELFKTRDVRFYILSVVTSATCRSIKKIYRFYEKNGMHDQHYITCIDLSQVKSTGMPWSLKPPRYEKFLKELFDYWYNDVMEGKSPHNKYFDDLLLMLNGQCSESCSMNGVCGRQYVVDADGSVYPCEYYIQDEWKIGSIPKDSFEDIDKNRHELQFIQQSAEPHTDCRACKWRHLCRSGCKRDRVPDGNSNIDKNQYCMAYYNFFEYAYPRLLQLYKRAALQRRGSVW